MLYIINAAVFCLLVAFVLCQKTFFVMHHIEYINKKCW